MTHPPLDALLAVPLPPEVEAHLHLCPRCRVAVRRHRAAPEAHEPPEPPEPPDAELHPGQTVGPWMVEVRLGAGAMATVYRVRHAATGELRALKLMEPSAEVVRQRFEREARAQSALDHPHVVRVRDVLSFGGRTGLILDLVPGPSLYDLLLEGPLELPATLRLGLDILDGLAVAHAAGLVHRDLKPANVLVDPSTDRPLARVADFGAAKEEAPGARLTRTGAVLGTPAYMAPEQVDDSSRVDARADVFAAGCVLYEMATGRRPFRGGTLLELFAAIRRGDRPPLPAGALPEPAARAIDGALVADRDARMSLAEVRALWARAVEASPPIGAETRARIAALAPGRGDDVPTVTLPPRTGALFGREEEIARAASAVTRHRHVVIAGPPGSGRRAVALEAARRAAAAFPGGVASAPPSEPGAGRALVVLDEGADAATVLADPRVHVIAAGPPGASGEAVIALGALPRAPSLALLRDRIRSLGGTEPDERTLDALLAATGGRPLALELAAALLRAEAPDALASGLAGEGDPLERCLARAWGRLGGEEREVLRAAAGLGAPWTASTLAEAAGIDELDAEDLVDALVFAGLVRSFRADGSLAFDIPAAIGAWVARAG